MSRSELIAAVPYFAYLGLRVDDEDRVVLPGVAHHGNDAERLHGGVLAAFLEAAASIELAHRGHAAARPASMTTEYLSPGHLDDTVATVRILHASRRFARLEVAAHQAHHADQPAPIAIAFGTWTLR